MSQWQRRDFIKAGTLAAAAGALGGTVGRAGAQGAPGPEGARALGELSYAASGVDRPWTVPQQKGPPVTIDMHTHWEPPAYLKAKAQLGHPSFKSPVNADMGRRVEWMNQNGVKALVLTQGGFMPWVWTTRQQGVRIARIINDAAIEAHEAYPDRFFAAIAIPVTDPQGAVQELNRVAGKPGLVAVEVPNSLAGRDYLFAPEFAPVLARCEELRLPLMFHPLDGKANWYDGDRLADQYSGSNPAWLHDPNAPGARFPGLTNSMGDPFESATTMAKLIVSGTLDKYPELVPVMMQGGGAFPYIAGRVEARTWGANHLKQPFPRYLRRFYYSDLTYWPVALRFLIDLVGIDRIMVGTDNMFGGDLKRMMQPNTAVDQLHLPPEQRNLILFGNARRLYRI